MLAVNVIISDIVIIVQLLRIIRNPLSVISVDFQFCLPFISFLNFTFF